MTEQRAKAWIVVGVFVAVVGFLFIDNYEPRRGFLYSLTEGVVGFDRRSQIIPYKFVLAAAFAIIAVGAWHLWVGGKGPDGKESDHGDSEPRDTGKKVADDTRHPSRQILLSAAFLVGLSVLGMFSIASNGQSSTLSQVLIAATAASLVWFVISLIGMGIRAIWRQFKSSD